jgi:hypothetical protein
MCGFGLGPKRHCDCDFLLAPPLGSGGLGCLHLLKQLGHHNLSSFYFSLFSDGVLRFFLGPGLDFNPPPSTS